MVKVYLSLGMLDNCIVVISLCFTGYSLGPLECQEREVELGKRRKLFSVYDVHEEIGR